VALAHSPKIVTDGLVLCLDAGNTKSYPGSGTTWSDLSGNGNNGSLVNMDGANLDSANGGSLTFDGSNEQVSLGSLKLNTAAGTISFWVKLDVNVTPSFTGNMRPFGSDTDFEMRWGPSGEGGNLWFDLGYSFSDGAKPTTKNNWNSNQWYNIVAVWDANASTSAWYIDGVLDSSSNVGVSAATLTALSGNLLIGSSGGIAGYLDGNISQFSAYNRALSASEVKQNFNALRGRFGL